MILSFLLISSSLKAEVEFNSNGYINNMFAYQKMNSAFKQLDSAYNVDNFATDILRVRFRPELIFSEETRITMHYEIDGMFSKVQLPYNTTSDMTNRQVVDLNWKLSDNKITDDVSFISNHYIDMLYIKQFFDWGELVLGRQVISWGTGRVWQPTDMFNPINPANFSKIERDGADALSTKIYISEFSDIDIVVNFRENLKDFNYAVRYRNKFDEYDVSLMTGHFDKKLIYGADFAGNLFDAGVRGEAIYSINPNDLDSNYIRLILGADYQLSAEWYAMLEYQFNGEGTSNIDEYVQYLSRLMKGEIQNIGQHYLAFVTSYLLHPLLSSSATVITNIGDASGMAGINLKYNMLQDMNIGLGSMFFFGSESSEYGLYPSALYLSMDWFF